MSDRTQTLLEWCQQRAEENHARRLTAVTASNEAYYRGEAEQFEALVVALSQPEQGEHFCTVEPHEATGGAVARCSCGWAGKVCPDRPTAERSADVHRAATTSRPEQGETPSLVLSDGDRERLQEIACVELIAAERRRQVAAEGWTPEHDDRHDSGEMVWAAECYLNPGAHVYTAKAAAPEGWPWERDAWKPACSSGGPESMGKVTTADAIRNLTKAGALIAAEIDRLTRKSSVDPASTQGEGGGEEDWPEVWLKRPTPVADAENYSVWGAASNDVVPHPNEDGEFCRYVPAPQALPAAVPSEASVLAEKLKVAEGQREVHRRNNERLLIEDRELREEVIAHRVALEELAAEFESKVSTTLPGPVRNAVEEFVSRLREKAAALKGDSDAR